MKKIITTCILSILMSAGAMQAGKYNSVNVTPGPNPSVSVWIKFIITFHRPKTLCQTGFGICFDIELGTDKAAGSGSTLCPVQGRIIGNGSFELMVSEEDLLRYENGFALPYFKKGSVTFEDPYTFSEPVTKQLGASKITINPGTYTVVFDAISRTYTITFPV